MLSVKQPVLTNRFYMKRFVIFFILGLYFVVFSSTSKQMYSIESGKVYAENHNISHVLSSSYPVDCKSSQEFDDALPTSGQCNHFHVMPLHPLTFDNIGGVNHDIKILPITFPFLLQTNIQVSPIVRSPDFFNKLKILTGSHLSSRKSSVLLI